MMRGLPVSEGFHGDIQDGIRENLVGIVIRDAGLDRDHRIRIRVDAVRELDLVEYRAVIDVLHGIPRYIEVPPSPLDPYAVEIDGIRQHHRGF